MTASCILKGPSKENGLVTIPIVNAPDSLAFFAIIGAAPVPVPPPIPHVIKTMSASLTISSISKIDSNAAFFPTSDLAPAPNPLNKFFPI